MVKTLKIVLIILFSGMFIYTCSADNGTPPEKKLSDSEVIDLLIKKLSSPDANERAKAAKALSKIGNRAKAAVKPLIKLLYDNNIKVRKIAIRALAKTGDRRAVEPLIALLKDKNAEIRRTVIMPLSMLGGKSAVDAINKALHDTNYIVRMESIYVLRDIGDETSVEPLIILLDNVDDKLRRASAVTLNIITGEDFGSNKEKWQKWWNANKDKFLKEKEMTK
jgi:HEAT repeat protein